MGKVQSLTVRSIAVPKTATTIFNSGAVQLAVTITAVHGIILPAIRAAMAGAKALAAAAVVAVKLVLTTDGTLGTAGGCSH